MELATSEYVSCTGVYKSLAAALNCDSVACVLVIGGPGCGKSTFTRRFLAERGYTVADVSEICERETLVKRVKTFCDSGGVDAMVRAVLGKKVVWVDDNLQMGALAFSCASAFGVPVVATSSAKAISKFPGLRRRCQIVKMNYPNAQKCTKFLKERFPDEAAAKLEQVSRGVNGCIPRAVSAVEQMGVSDYIEDRRRMDMSVYEIAESTVKIARGYQEVKSMTSSEPVMFALILQEMGGGSEKGLRDCIDMLALGDQSIAEVACFSGFLHASARAKAKFPRCYSLASPKASVNRMTHELCTKRGLVPWQSAFLFAKRNKNPS